MCYSSLLIKFLVLVYADDRHMPMWCLNSDKIRAVNTWQPACGLNHITNAVATASVSAQWHIAGA